MTRLTHRFNDALTYAFQLHKNQYRKGTGVPYLTHLLGVTALVLEAGGDEDQAIAALLHDAVEDQGGRKTLDEINRRFGDRVAEIVDGCTDTYASPKPSWRKRKENYLEHLRTSPPYIRKVALADKIHNARSILFDLKSHNDKVWRRFNGGKEGTLWYYRSLVNIFQEIEPSPIVDELSKIVEEIESYPRIEEKDG